MIDDRDITKLKEVFATKEDFVEVKFEVAELKDRVDHLETSLTHKIDVQADRLAGLITDFLDESRVASAQDEERDQKLEDHEKRLRYLEAKPA